jgi:hypothetical protein
MPSEFHEVRAAMVFLLRRINGLDGARQSRSHSTARQDRARRPQ